MDRTAHCFETAFGICEIRWSEVGITSLTLLEEGAADTLPPHAPAFVPVAVCAIREHLAGRAQRFDNLPIDLSALRGFARRVLEATRQLGPGETRSYGDLARELGSPGAARAVGQALGRNPVLLLIPCHRVVATGGRTGGFSAPGGFATKLRMLALEGVNLC
jgi:methylated-DNA-[protein]-cysteine S-methyltransferase